MTYNDLLLEAEKEGIEVIEDSNIGRLKGLYCDNTISLSKNLKSEKEKKCVLCEEIGHYYTSYGNILRQTKVGNRQQERKARVWAYYKLVPLKAFINAFKVGIRNRYELAEFLDVTENFLIETLRYYKEKYGVYYEYKNYIIYFEPLGVLENF